MAKGVSCVSPSPSNVKSYVCFNSFHGWYSQFDLPVDWKFFYLKYNLDFDNLNNI